MTTIRNFVGFETGDVEELSATAGSPSISNTAADVRTGTYGLVIASSGDQADIDVSSAQGDGGYVLGFAFSLPTADPTFGSQMVRLLDSASDDILGFNYNADGSLDLLNEAGTTLVTVTLNWANDEWVYVEVYFQNATTGNYELFVNGTSEGSGSSDFQGTGGADDLTTIRFLSTNSDPTFRFDDVYLMSGASAASDRLGVNRVSEPLMPQVLGAFQNTVEDATDQGTTLDDGTWALVGETPGNDGTGNDAQYNGSGAQDGHTLTDNADSNARPGPDGDSDVVEGEYNLDGQYLANGVNFDGTSDYLSFSDSLTGVSDGKLVTGSFWFRRGATGSGRIIDFAASNFMIGFLASNEISVTAQDSNDATILDVETTAITDTSDWHHCMFSFDMANTSNRHIYINGVSDLNAVNTYTNAEIEFTTNEVRIGASFGGGVKYNGDIADLWLLPGTYIDLSIPGNRRLFYKGGGAPYLGASGQKPTGTPPLMFFQGATADWHTNKGTGGGFTENGALTDASTDPDPASGIIAGKWIAELERGNGSGTSHFHNFGNSGDGVQQTADLGLGSTYAIYEQVSEDFGIVPTSSESFAHGFAKSSGGREIFCADLWCTALHLPGYNVCIETEATGTAGLQKQANLLLDAIATGIAAVVETFIPGGGGTTTDVDVDANAVIVTGKH